MSVIYILIVVSLCIAILFFIAFIISVRSGQFDDSVTPSIRMLFEDKKTKKNHESNPLDKS